MNRREGELIALHRKIHLFDIDIPGKITFKLSLLSATVEIWLKQQYRKARHLQEETLSTISTLVSYLS